MCYKYAYMESPHPHLHNRLRAATGIMFISVVFASVAGASWGAAEHAQDVAQQLESVDEGHAVAESERAYAQDKRIGAIVAGAVTLLGAGLAGDLAFRRRQQ